MPNPDQVLFGAPLNGEFFSRMAEDLPAVDLLIVAGTSLVVAPANSVVYEVPEACVRLIVNREQVGREVYGERPKPNANPNPTLRPDPTQVGEELGVVYGESPDGDALQRGVRDVFGELALSLTLTLTLARTRTSTLALALALALL